MKYYISILIALITGITVGYCAQSIALGAIIAALVNVIGNLICTKFI